MLSLVSRKDKDPNNSSSTNKINDSATAFKKGPKTATEFYKKYSLPELLFVQHTSL